MIPESSPPDGLEPNDDGRPWGFVEDGVWRALPKRPMLLAGLGPPPFTVELPGGPREIIHQPEGPQHGD